MPNYGVIVGRFQVNELHDGHMELLRMVCGLHNRVIVFLGVPSTLCTKRNPLDFETRRRMIQAKFPSVTVAPLPDMPDDDQWSKTLDHRIRELAPFGEITLYGGRDSFVPVYTGQFKPVELQLTIRNTSGEEVRAEVSSRIMETSDFRAGVIYATQNRFPAAIMCVDAAVMRDGFVLLAKKPTDKGWRFIGGHLDPRDRNLEYAVRREVMEETGLAVESTRFIGSGKRSKRGRLGLFQRGDGDYTTLSLQPGLGYDGDQLQTVFKNGSMLNVQGLDEIRQRAELPIGVTTIV